MQIAIDYTLFLVRTALLVLSAIGLNSILRRSHGLADRYNQENVENIILVILSRVNIMPDRYRMKEHLIYACL
jgi:hypothetical protein